MATNQHISEEQHLSTQLLLTGELYRRLRLFDQAVKHFKTLQKNPALHAKQLNNIVKYQLEPINHQDSGPHPIPQEEK